MPKVTYYRTNELQIDVSAENIALKPLHNAALELIIAASDTSLSICSM